MPFVDELASGVAPAGVPELARDLGISPGTAAGAIIVAFHSLALLVEAPLLAWADRGRVRVVSAASLLAVAVSCALAALAPGPTTLLVALALYGPAAGVALSAAEGLLVESRPDERERTMARLSLAGVAGDLAVPALLALLAPVGLGWRTVMGVAALTSIALAAMHARSRALDRPMATADDEDDEDASGPRPPLRELLRVLRATPALVAWSLAGVLVSLLDEVLVAFGVVHLDANLHASAAWRAAAVAGWTLGGAAGLVVLERALSRVDPRRVLAASGALTVVALTAFAFAPSPAVAAVALTVVGATGVAFHPLAKARAYAALPGRPALVNATASLLLPLEALAPAGLSLIAHGVGARAAVLAILVAPMGIGVAAWLDEKRSAR